MPATWTPADLQRIDAATELEIAVPRADGTSRPFVPIWAVVAGGSVYVRTWYRRDTGWFGRAVHAGRARVRVPGLAADVTVEDVGAGTPDLRVAVDSAYRTKYGRHGGSVDRMVADEAVAATLRLTPDGPRAT